MARRDRSDSVVDVSHSTFFTEQAKARVREAVKAIEAASSAEIVVAVRHQSGHYRHADLGAGCLAALTALCVFLYHPEPFEFTFLPLELTGVFAAAAVLTSFAPPIRRLLVTRSSMARSVHVAARAMFVDRGITRTTGRTGVLVYVSILERRVEVVCDIGVDEKTLGQRFVDARRHLEQSLAGGEEFDGFVRCLEALAGPLAAGLPRAAEDRNELSDEVV